MISLDIRETPSRKPKTYVIPDELKAKITTSDHRKPSEVGWRPRPADPKSTKLDVEIPTNRGKPKPGKKSVETEEEASWASLLSR